MLDEIAYVLAMRTRSDFELGIEIINFFW